MLQVRVILEVLAEQRGFQMMFQLNLLLLYNQARMRLSPSLPVVQGETLLHKSGRRLIVLEAPLGAIHAERLIPEQAGVISFQITSHLQERIQITVHSGSILIAKPVVEGKGATLLLSATANNERRISVWSKVPLIKQNMRCL